MSSVGDVRRSNKNIHKSSLIMKAGGGFHSSFIQVGIKCTFVRFTRRNLLGEISHTLARIPAPLTGMEEVEEEEGAGVPSAVGRPER